MHYIEVKSAKCYDDQLFSDLSYFNILHLQWKQKETERLQELRSVIVGIVCSGLLWHLLGIRKIWHL